VSYPFILVVDGNKEDMGQYRTMLEGAGIDCALLPANDLETAANDVAFNRGNIVAIIIDGAVPMTFADIEKGEDRLTSLLFVQNVRNSGFEGLIVAASPRQDYGNTMVQYGCTNALPKDEAAQYVINWRRGVYQ
jgi:hypothetical protein